MCFSALLRIKETEKEAVRQKQLKKIQTVSQEAAKVAIKKQEEIEANKQKQIKQAADDLVDPAARRRRITAKNQEEMNKGLAGKGRKTRRNLRLR